MKSIFVDANAWIALNHKRDQFHDKAVKTNRELLKKQSRYITTNYVLAESYTWLLRKVGHFAAVEFGDNVQKSEVVRSIHVTEEMEDDAWHL
jgi:predicted nucleic acid-binding protein